MSNRCVRDGAARVAAWDRVRPWAVVVLVAFALNMIWELAQLPLYAGHDDLGLRLLYRAGGNDAALILVAAGIGRVADRWSRPWAWTTLLVTLAATAVFIEARAITTGRWSYSDLMPTLGIVGLSPLLQLPVTGWLAVVLARPDAPAVPPTRTRGRRR